MMKNEAAARKGQIALGRFGDRLGSAVAAAALAGSLTLILLGALGVPGNAWVAFTTAALVGLVMTAATTSWLVALGTAAAGAVALFVMHRLGVRPWEELLALVRSMIQEDGGARAALLLHPEAITAVAAFLLGALMYAMARVQDGVYPAAMLALVLLLADWYLAHETQWLPMVLALFALGALFARSHNVQTPWRRVLPIALIAALLAQACVPPAGTTWAPLADAADRMRTLIMDYFRFTTPRTSYSVSRDGWQQLGERLGGPAAPEKEAAMAVRTDRPVLLRGSIRGLYTGYSWSDAGQNSRYVYIDPTKASLRARVLGTAALRGLDTAGALAPESVAVRFLGEGSSSLFVPGIVESVSAPIDMAVYFNDAGEVFLTRDVREGDAYRAEGYSPLYGERLEQLIQKASGLQDEYYEAIRETYTALPEGIDRGVYQLAQQVVAGSTTPYEAVSRLCDHLRSGAYRYATEVEYPPYGRDFVSHFLLDTRTGYCTYFASALAVMARMFGIPSRYVEGYRVVPGGGEETIVTGEDAHAWVEIYFRGQGWIAFDPTPGETSGEDGGDSPRDSQETPAPGEPSPSPEPPESEQTPEPTSTPEPEQTLEPTPSPEPEDQPPEDEPTQPPEDGESENTPPPSDPDAGEPTPPPEADPRGDRRRLWPILLAAIAFAAAVALLLARERATRPETVAARQDKAGDKLLVWYRALLAVLEGSGLGPKGGETPMAAAHRLSDADPGWASALQLAEVVTACQYGGGVPNEKALDLGRRAYHQALGKVGKRARARFLARRVLHGFGDWRRIPT